MPDGDEKTPDGYTKGKKDVVEQYRSQNTKIKVTRTSYGKYGYEVEYQGDSPMGTLGVVDMLVKEIEKRYGTTTKTSD